METSEKPKIESKKAVIPCHRYGELIASESSNFIINHDTEETPPKTISCPYCKKTISTKGAEVFETYLDRALAACQEYDDELGDETFDK